MLQAADAGSEEDAGLLPVTRLGACRALALPVKPRISNPALRLSGRHDPLSRLPACETRMRVDNANFQIAPSQPDRYQPSGMDQEWACSPERENPRS